MPWPPYQGPAPSGNSTEASHRYYDWIFHQYYDDFPIVSWRINYWEPFFFLYMWAAVLIAGFFVFSFFAFRSRRDPGDRYGGELYSDFSYNGYLTERDGKVEWFTWYTMIVLFGAALFYIIAHALEGQAY